MSVTTRTYTVTMTTDNATGRTQIDKVNDGFDALQLLGLLDWSREDVIAQIRGKIIPDTVKRTVVE